MITEIERLLEHHTDGQIAAQLKERGFRPGMGGPFNSRIVANIRRGHGLKDRYFHLRQAGKFTAEEYE